MPSDANIMEIRNDFEELFELFSVSTIRRPFRESPQDNKHKVEYVVVGGGSFPLSTGLRREHLDSSPVFGELFALHP